MDFIKFDKRDFQEIRPNVFLENRSVNMVDVPIYKYIDLSALMDIADGNYMVKRRKEFSDLTEQGRLSNPFIERILPYGYSATQSDLDRWGDLKKRRKLSANILTSCFTLESDELYVMWKSYTIGYTGVRIKTTINQFLDTINIDGYELYVGMIKYSTLNVGAYDFTAYMFNKNIGYKTEKELRIYFIPKILGRGETTASESHVIIKVDNTNFISEILLSPFIPSKLKGGAISYLKNKFSEIEISHSRILESIN